MKSTTVTQINKNAFGGWWVDVIEISKDGQRIVDTQNFAGYEQAEAFCDDFQSAKLDEYKNAFDDMFGQPMEALNNLTAREGSKGGE